jgi:sugar transferase (PEP-CTERM system associated)
MVRILNQYVSPKGIVLMLLEGGLLTLALLCAVRIRFWGSAASFNDYVALPDFAWQAAVFVVTLQVCFYYCDLYRPGAIRGRNEQWIALGQSLGSGCLLLGIVYFIFPSLLLGRGIFFISVALVPAFVTCSRVALDRIWQSAAPKENVVIIGAGELAITVASQLLKRNDLNVELAGFFDVHGAAGEDRTLFGRPVFDLGADLQAVVEQHQASRIIVALEDRRNALPTRELVRLRVQGIRVEDAHSTISALTGRVWLETVKPSWFVFSDGFRRSTITQILKRVIDLTSGVVGLTVSLPLMLLVAVAIRLDSKGPVIFRQRRVGLRGKCFEVLKFRSMRVDAEEGTGARWAADNDPRVTRVGRFLRKYRLDELPQFMNVMRGEMSLVGPRPERPEFVDELRKQISYYDERHSVRPGITGWAQVKYRYGSNLADAVRKLEYDLFYLKNMSMFFDCAIILDTVRIVLGGHGGR